MRISVSELDRSEIQEHMDRAASCLSKKPFVVLLYTRKCYYCKQLMDDDEKTGQISVWNEFIRECKRERKNNVIQFDVSNPLIVQNIDSVLITLINAFQSIQSIQSFQSIQKETDISMKTQSKLKRKICCLKVLKTLLQNTSGGVPSITFVAIDNKSNGELDEVIVPYEGERTSQALTSVFTKLNTRSIKLKN